MFEDKLPILYDVMVKLILFYDIIFYRLQLAKKKGIPIPNNDEIIVSEISSRRGKDSIENFSSLISKSNKDIKFISDKINDLISLKSSISDADKDEEQELSKKMNSIINDIIEARGRMDKTIKELEFDMKNKNNDENSDPNIIKDDSDLRTKKNLFDAMITKYRKVIQKFQNEENEMKKIKEVKLFRTAEIGLGRDLTEKEKEQVMEDPGMIQQIYEDKLKGKAHVQLQNAVRDLEERHRDIKKLEKSIIELSKMILELNKLVKYQGEMIDNIVENVSKSKDYVVKGEKELIKGKKHMKCTKKIKCTIVIIASVALLIIILPILIKFL